MYRSWIPYKYHLNISFFSFALLSICIGYKIIKEWLFIIIYIYLLFSEVNKNYKSSKSMVFVYTPKSQNLKLQRSSWHLKNGELTTNNWVSQCFRRLTKLWIYSYSRARLGLICKVSRDNRLAHLFSRLLSLSNSRWTNFNIDFKRESDPKSNNIQVFFIK